MSSTASEARPPAGVSPREESLGWALAHHEGAAAVAALAAVLVFATLTLLAVRGFGMCLWCGEHDGRHLPSCRRRR